MEKTLKNKIIEGALALVEKKGVHFTMDDLAAELGMSKKTIYTVFREKKALMIEMVDYVFDRIKESEAQVLKEKNLSLVDRLRKLLGVMPESYKGFDFTQFYLVKDKYPEAYDHMMVRLESGWEKTFELMDEGVSEGVLKQVDQRIFQLVFQASIERFLSGDELQQQGISYMEALEGLVDIMVDGIVIKK